MNGNDVLYDLIFLYDIKLQRDDINVFATKTIDHLLSIRDFDKNRLVNLEEI